MALSGYLGALKRRKWIFLVAVLITTASGVYFSSRQAPLYSSSAQVLLNPNQQLTTGAGSANGDAEARYDATQAEVAHTLNVATIALKQHPIPGVTEHSLLAMSSVSANASSNILTLTAQSRTAKTATAIANGLSTAFVIYDRRLDTAGIQKAIGALNSQIKVLTKAINAAKKANATVDGQRTELRGLVRKQQQLQQLELLQTGGAQVSELAAGARQVEPQPKRNALLGAILGVVIGLALVFVREAFDSRVRSSGEISDALRLPLLARLPTPPRALRSHDRLALLSEDHQQTHGEGYRQLRVALDFANLSAGAKTVMVTSAIEQEGKSTTVSNLAVAIARAGRRVVLVDLDERAPYLDRLFGLRATPGVTNVALGHVPLDDALMDVPIPASSTSASGSEIQSRGGRLQVLTAGTVPPDPAEFLETAALHALLAQLEARSDIVLIDAPPLLPVSDATTLSRSAGAVIVVVQAKTATRPMLSELRRMLDMCSARVLGFALTGADQADVYGQAYGYGYGGAPRVVGGPDETAAARLDGRLRPVTPPASGDPRPAS